MDFRANVNMVGKLLTGKGPQIVRDNQIAAMHDATQYGAKRVKERTPQGVFGAQGGLIGSIQPEVRKVRSVSGESLERPAFTGLWWKRQAARQGYAAGFRIIL